MGTRNKTKLQPGDSDHGVVVNPSPEKSTARKIFSLFKPQPLDQSASYARPHLPHADTGDEEVSGYGLPPDLVRKGDQTSLERYYVPIDTYEGRHRYDPKATWSKEEESALIRRLDLRVCAWWYVLSKPRHLSRCCFLSPNSWPKGIRLCSKFINRVFLFSRVLLTLKSEAVSCSSRYS